MQYIITQEELDSIKNTARLKGHDAGQLIDIKQGKYSLEQIKDMANDLFRKTEDAFLASKFPNRPDCEKVNELIEIVESMI